jgi:hypothetical protein
VAPADVVVDASPTWAGFETILNIVNFGDAANAVITKKLFAKDVISAAHVAKVGHAYCCCMNVPVFLLQQQVPNVSLFAQMLIRNVDSGGELARSSGWCKLYRLLVFLGENIRELKRDLDVLRKLQGRYLLGVDVSSKACQNEHCFVAAAPVVCARCCD